MSFKLKIWKIVLVILVFFITYTMYATTYIVTNTSDAGAGSFRQAIIDANSNSGTDAIDMTGVTGTITLASTLPTITEAVTITGPGANSLVVSGNDLYRVLTITATTTISGLKFCNGYSNYGGALNVTAGILTITNCAFYNNNNPAFDNFNSGGGLFNNGATVIITGSTFKTNHGGVGGAIKNESGIMTVTNCTFYNNQSSASSSGGGAINNNGICNLINCTISTNSAQYWGGGVYNTWNLNFKNTIIAYNTAGSGGYDFYGVGTQNSQDYNIVRYNSNSNITGTETNNIYGTDPLLNALADNGGTTETISLQSTSVAINMLPSGGNGSPSTDQRGYSRSGNTDCGAYEYPGALIITPTLSEWALILLGISAAGFGGWFVWKRMV